MGTGYQGMAFRVRPHSARSLSEPRLVILTETRTCVLGEDRGLLGAAVSLWKAMYVSVLCHV